MRNNRPDTIAVMNDVTRDPRDGPWHTPVNPPEQTLLDQHLWRCSDIWPVARFRPVPPDIPDGGFENSWFFSWGQISAFVTLSFSSLKTVRSSVQYNSFLFLWLSIHIWFILFYWCRFQNSRGFEKKPPKSKETLTPIMGLSSVDLRFGTLWSTGFMAWRS